MRVIMLNDFSVAKGGATTLALLATRLLRERGHEVVYITGDVGGSPVLHDLGVKEFALGGTKLGNGSAGMAFRGIWNRDAKAFLEKWIASNGRDDDVWHLHNWSQILSPSIFAALAPVWDRLIVHAHDFFNACPNGAFWDYQAHERCERRALSFECLSTNCDKRKPIHKAWRSMRQMTLGTTFRRENAPKLLLIHPGMQDFFVRSGFLAQRMQTLRNPGVPFLNRKVDAAAQDRLLYIGRFDEEKGPLGLARAAHAAGVGITFIGDGPQADAIRKACPSAVLTGWLNREQIARHAAGARALVMPSTNPEPFGLVAVEAMGCGIPVVASHTALIAQEITAADAGWSVDVRDAEAFKKLLAHIRTADEEVRRKSAIAMAVAPELCLSAEQWCDGLEQIYRAQLVARTPCLV